MKMIYHANTSQKICSKNSNIYKKNINEDKTVIELHINAPSIWLQLSIPSVLRNP